MGYKSHDPFRFQLRLSLFYLFQAPLPLISLFLLCFPVAGVWLISTAMGGGPPYLELFVEETSLYNRIVLGTIFPAFALDPLPHIVQTWLRNCIGGFLIYFFSCCLWCFYLYYWKRNIYIPKGFPLFWFSISTAPFTTSNSGYLASLISFCSLLGHFLIKNLDDPFANLSRCCQIDGAGFFNLFFFHVCILHVILISDSFGFH